MKRKGFESDNKGNCSFDPEPQSTDETLYSSSVLQSIE